MKINLNDEIALVTGGSKGIGRASCLALAKAGAFVAVNYNSSIDEAKKTVDEINSLGGKSDIYKADVSSEEEVSNMFKKIKDKFGAIDILVNNGGVIEDSLLISMTSNAWKKVVDINLGGVYNCTREATKMMIRKKKGKVINISSVVALSGGAGQANYAAAKAGIVSFTRACAVEMGKRGIQFNTILPGMIVTDMSSKVREIAGEDILKRIPAGRFGEPSEIGDLVLFLASSYSDYINGTAIPIDGGLLTI
jgi:3-oxoacyl-[acyl-carrier protein] reductase